jgi:hypothetical protein
MAAASFEGKESRARLGWLAEPGVLAAGVSLIPRIDSCLSSEFIPKNNLWPLSCGATKGVAYRAW